ncbi:MAG: glycoside hydrolase family 2 TIM barrel-domain containing protein [Candidatus Acidiferrales bacterium]|jgi:beta-glucuronidase
MITKPFLILFFLFASVASAAPAPAPSNLIANVSGRATVSLSGVWRVIVDPYENGLSAHFYENAKPRDKSALVEYDFDTSGTLLVPGDWNSQRESLYYYEGPIWYKKSFTYRKQPHKRVFIYFGAANYLARVYLNGKRIGEHEGGFTPFNFEVTDQIVDDDNFLIVEVSNARHPDAIPAMSTDWWNYGGLTRDVTLVEMPETFIQDYFVQLAKGSANEIAGWVKLNGVDTGASASQQVTLAIPEAGIKQTVQTDGNGTATFRFSARLKLWSPDEPTLYRVVLSAASDTISDEIGFRTIETRGTQILLNGKPIFLRGISMHDEAPFTGGRAFSEDQDRVLLGWARELGCNFVRLAHYPHNEATVRLADRMGFLVWAEIPVYWDIAWDNPKTLEAAEEQMRDMVARDHNRAAVILWSLSNETPLTALRLEFLKSFAAYTRQLDPTRLLTSAMNRTARQGPNTILINDPLGEYVDVLGLNEYIGWYQERPEDADRTRWKTAFEKPVLVSEFGGSARFGLHGDAQTRWSEEYQANLYEHQIKMLREMPFLAGMSPWILMDFHSPRRYLTGIQDDRNRKGLVSDQGQKKQAFFVLQRFYRELAAGPK